MALQSKVKSLLSEIESHKEYLEHNKVLFDIHQGNLKPYILDDLRSSLSTNYFEKIKTRIIPINILKRIIDKLAKVYSTEPIRDIGLEEGQASKDMELLQEYESALEIDVQLNDADEFSHLFKGFALEPYYKEGEDLIKLRVLPFDRFLVISEDSVDPTEPTIFIKFMGEREVLVADRRLAAGVRSEMREVYYAYSDDEFYAFDSKGDTYIDAMTDNAGVNPYGQIPFIYGNKSRYELIPVQDSDLLALTKVIPVMLSDASGAILFQCFSIIYGIDLDAEDLTMSPNAFWNFKSDTAREGKPTIGTIKPEADIDKILNFILSVLTTWLEAKGISAGNIGNVDAGNVASGISKVIDEMDTTEIRKLSIAFFKKVETRFWDLLSVMHNYHVVDLGNVPMFSKDFKVKVQFDDPKPILDREKEVRTVKTEVDAGFLDMESAIKQLYPDISQDEVDARLVTNEIQIEEEAEVDAAAITNMEKEDDKKEK